MAAKIWRRSGHRYRLGARIPRLAPDVGGSNDSIVFLAARPRALAMHPRFLAVHPRSLAVHSGPVGVFP